MTISGALLSLLMGAACATPLDKARIAWSEGEGEFTEAEPFYEEAVAADDNESEIAREEFFEIHMDLAAANKKEHPKEAEQHYRAALKLDPASAEARTGLIRLLMTLYRYEEAFALANEGTNSGDCPGCKRLLAVMLIQSGDQRSETEDWPSAEAAYAAAMDMLPDASVALGLTRARVAQGKVEPAVQSLSMAAEMIDQNDIEGRRRFLELRRALVLAALEATNPDLADKALDVAPKGVGAQEQLGLAVEVAMQLTKVGKADEALSRMQALAQAAEQGRLRVSDEQKGELLIRVALLFGARANQKLANGDAEGASADLEEAHKLIPGEPTITMQKAIVYGAEGNIKKAREEMTKVNRKTPGYRTVDAVLYAMEADKLIEQGKVGLASDLVGYGKRADPDAPEIHIAAAQVLAATPFDDMLKAEQKDLRKRGLVKYPKGKHKPLKTGEALSELAWAAKVLEAQDSLFPFRDPDAKDRLEQTKATLTAFYPYAVAFESDPHAVLVLKNTSPAELTVVTEKGRFFRKKKKIEANGSVEVKLSKPGVITFTYGEEEEVAMFVAEPHTKVEISLPPAATAP
ncbi:MAG: tetratricopeptide repeat protein [Myxococcota bacterium]